MTTATITQSAPPPRYGLQGTIEQPAPTITSKPLPLAAPPPLGWSLREMGAYRGIVCRQRGDDWSIDGFFLHHADGTDAIAPAIRAKVDAIRQQLSERVVKVVSELPVGKQYQAALAELKEHESAAKDRHRQLQRLTAQRQAEALAERPSAAKLTKLDGEIAEVELTFRNAEQLASKIRPIVDERRKAVQAELDLLAQKEFTAIYDQLTAERKKAMAALTAAAGDALRELVVIDQARSQVTVGTTGLVSTAALAGLATPQT